MAIIVDTGDKKITTQKKLYGKLIVETTITPQDDKVIVLGENGQVNQHNVQGLNNTQPKINNENKVNATLKSNKNIDIRRLVDVTSSVKLTKGEKLSLKGIAKNLSKLIVTLDYKTMQSSNKEFDLDTSVFMVDKNDKAQEKDFIFYENNKSTCGGVKIKEDHNTRLKEAYNESIQLDLNLIPMHIQKLAFAITIYEAKERLQNFGQVSDGYFRIIAGDTKKEILRYKFNNNLSIETAMVVAEIYRYKDEWKINCIGSGFIGGLEALCNNYGIDTI